jgi:hypothetical protein
VQVAVGADARVAVHPPGATETIEALEHHEARAGTLLREVIRAAKCSVETGSVCRGASVVVIEVVPVITRRKAAARADYATGGPGSELTLVTIQLGGSCPLTRGRQ